MFMQNHVNSIDFIKKHLKVS